jgi:hypothetical protein
MPKKDGGSASTMTMRDFFAAFALQPLVQYYQSKEASAAVIAEDAYHYADAMLKQREELNER